MSDEYKPPVVHAIRGGYDIVPPSEPVPEVLAALEKALAEARSGELRAVAIAGICRTGFPYTNWATTYETAGPPLAGAIARLTFRYHMDWHGAQ